MAAIYQGLSKHQEVWLFVYFYVLFKGYSLSGSNKLCNAAIQNDTGMLDKMLALLFVKVTFKGPLISRDHGILIHRDQSWFFAGEKDFFVLKGKQEFSPLV